MNARRDPSAPDLARQLGRQLLCLTPFFWVMELAQNQLYRWFQGEYGWVYPAAGGRWFYPPSMLLWAGALALMWVLDLRLFRPRAVPGWVRVAALAAACWAGEWLSGFAADRLLHVPMQRWPGSPLVYVGWSAYWFWCLDVLCYDQLRQWIAPELATGSPVLPVV